MENTFEIKNELHERINLLNDELDDEPTSWFLKNKEELGSLLWYNKELKNAKICYKIFGFPAIAAFLYLFVMIIALRLQWLSAPEFSVKGAIGNILVLLLIIQRTYAYKLKIEKLKYAIFLFGLNVKI